MDATNQDAANGVSDIYQIAENLVEQALVSKEHGDPQSYRRLIRITVNRILEEGSPKRPQNTAKVLELLETGWQDVAAITDVTGLSPNRVHMILTHLRSKGMNIQSKTIKRYRIQK